MSEINRLLLERHSVEAFRRQIVIIFSAYNIETMAKRFKTIKEVDPEEPRSGKGRGAQRCKAWYNDRNPMSGK
jgi:hypothetical protein